jgi:hypothetical protein
MTPSDGLHVVLKLRLIDDDTDELVILKHLNDRMICR